MCVCFRNYILIFERNPFHQQFFHVVEQVSSSSESNLDSRGDITQVETVMQSISLPQPQKLAGVLWQ